LALAVIVLAGACTGGRTETVKIQVTGGPMSTIDRNQAVAKATRSLEDLGRDPARYDMEVAETAAAWQVSFAGKMPRPPGDEVSFTIDKRSGAVRTLLGE
jgi:hypothetical protein